MENIRKKRNLITKFRKPKALLKILYKPELDIKKVLEHRKKLIDSENVVKTKLC